MNSVTSSASGPGRGHRGGWARRKPDLPPDDGSDFDAAAELAELIEKARLKRELKKPLHGSSRLDAYKARLLKLRAAGASLSKMQMWLKDKHGVTVDPSTISRWLKKNG